MENWKKDRIGSCVIGTNPTMMVRMKSGFAVMADNQFLPGYCILLRYPRVDSLAQLSPEERKQYLYDTTLIGDAIEIVLKPRRINYSTLMNKDDFLHTHIEARYDWEPEPYKYQPSWTYPQEKRYRQEYEFNVEKYGSLKEKLTEALRQLMARETA